MTAADTVPPIRLDRYIALLAILMALVLGLLVIGERQKGAALPEPVVGSLPPPPDPRLAAFIAERESLLAEQVRLAEALTTTEAALRRAEAEATALAEENERLRQLLGDEGAALDNLTGRLAAAESERDRLSAEVRTLSRARQELEARIVALETAPTAAPETPPFSTNDSADLPTGRSTELDLARGDVQALPAPLEAPDAATSRQPSSLAAAVAELRRDQGATRLAEPSATGDRVAPLALPRSSAPSSSASDLGASDSGVPDSGLADSAVFGSTVPESDVSEAGAAEAIGAPRRLTTFSSDGSGTLEEGITAYNAGDYVNAERIWGRLAAAGDPRGAFYFGSILSEGRNAPPDRVMAHVWLSRSVDAGYLPAIDVRRQVRAAMSEAEYEEALAIEADG